MAFLKTFVKALKSIFKGPTATKKRMVKRSTTETRYAAAPKSLKRSKGKNNKVEDQEEAPVKKKKRSAKTYLKKSPKLQPSGLKRSAEGRSLRPKKLTEAAEKLAKAPPKEKKSKAVKPPSKEFYVGEITHYFSKISVVVVKVSDHPLLIGDQIHIKGSAEFSQKVESLQVESKDVRFARRGELVGLQVIQPAKPGDKVFKSKK